jgi:hypothetical protein
VPYLVHMSAALLIWLLHPIYESKTTHHTGTLPQTCDTAAAPLFCLQVNEVTPALFAVAPDAAAMAAQDIPTVQGNLLYSIDLWLCWPSGRCII